MNTAPENPGAAAFCRDNPAAPSVPAFATGHAAAYTYRCLDGHATIVGGTFPLDSRGFAATLWAPVN